MTTHIALEEGRDLETVATWSVERKLFHAQMLGAYHEHRNDQMERAQDGYNADYGTHPDGTGQTPPTDTPPAHAAAGPATSPASPPTPGGGGGGGGAGSHPATARHENTFTVADEDTDWQLCEQCHGLFEPDGEYDRHFDLPDFNCTRPA